jgi:hypothetical protein
VQRLANELESPELFIQGFSRSVPAAAPGADQGASDVPDTLMEIPERDCGRALPGVFFLRTLVANADMKGYRRDDD